MRSILGAIGAPVAAAPSRSLRHELVTRGRRHAAGWGRVQPGPPGPGRERTPNSAHVEVCRHERDRAGGRLRSLTFHRRGPPEGGGGGPGAGEEHPVNPSPFYILFPLFLLKKKKKYKIQQR